MRACNMCPGPGFDPTEQTGQVYLGGVLGIDVNGVRQPIDEDGIVHLAASTQEAVDAAERADQSAEDAAESATEAAASAAAAQTAAERDVPAAAAAWLSENVDPETGYVIDSSLSIQGAAADAKAAGDSITPRVSLKTSYAETIPNGTDYDTLRTPGNYSVATAAAAQSMVNCPTTAAHRLFVLEIIPGRYLQLVFSNSTATTPEYRRIYGSSSWSDWFRIATRNDIPQLDTTLTIQGAAADAEAAGTQIAAASASAKAAGDAVIGDLPTRGASWLKWTFGYTILSSGTISSYVRHAYSEEFAVYPGQVVQRLTPAKDSLDYTLRMYVCVYNNGAFVSRSPAIAHGKTYAIPDTATSARFVFGYDSGDSARALTPAALMEYFNVKFAALPSMGDGRKPVYVAFGASTTVGAVHHYTGESVTYSTLAYPDYIGQALGLETHNLGQGTTGFLFRDSGNKPNFMDSIYNNDETLDKADLITLTFGYGNDRTAGLLFGEWDDYFPYDEVGAFFVQGQTAANQAGVATMLDAGATLMGCLNWCIKWIGEHYPKALLVCIWGAPSANDSYPVTVSANDASGAGTTGVAPKKIRCDRPDALDANTSEVEKLRDKLNIPFIDLIRDVAPFSYYAGRAQNTDGTYAIFSTKGTVSEPVWNLHPNDDGYLVYARYLAGRISQFFRH